MNPKHSISFCPICGGGLCGIRVCDGPLPSNFASCDTSPDHAVPDDDPMRDRPSWKRPSTQFANENERTNQSAASRHGLVVCDECEAIWLSPDTGTVHLYPDPENARCPVCRDALWGQASHWASMVEIDDLGWMTAVNPKLDHASDEGVA